LPTREERWAQKRAHPTKASEPVAQAAISQTLHIPVIAQQQGFDNLHASSTNQGDAMLELNRQTQPAVQRRLITSLAHSEEEVLEAQRLRYKVFAEETGANLPSN
jgi:hypothetical protein